MSKYAVRDHLRLFTHTTPLVAPPTFLLPSIVHRSHHREHHPRILHQKKQPIRWLATVAPHSRPQDHAVRVVEEENEARTTLNNILINTIKDPKLRTSLLEPYLPRHLQRKNRREADAVFADTDRPVPIHGLHVWLTKARKTKEPAGDLLSYLLVKENRQDAVVWLVEAMLKVHARDSHNLNTLWKPPSVLQQSLPVPSLRDLTYSAGATGDYVEPQRSSGVPLDELSAPAKRSPSHKCLGEIWRSVGSMILQAADHEPNSAKSRSIMTCVLRILAHVHHFEAVPPSIYDQPPALDPSVLQRPPTLYFWSHRIMMDLSDVSLNSTRSNPVANQGEALSFAQSNVVQSKESSIDDTGQLVPEVEPQIWLDFVLWCCVDGGWITEAAEIVDEMETRSIDEQQYSVIDWNTLRTQTAPKLPWTTRIKIAINGSRMREFAGGPTIGIYDERASPLKPPARTVSSEVIAAIVDGSVSRYHQVHGRVPSDVQQHIRACKNMLDRKGVGLGSNSWDSVILRMVESSSSGSETTQMSRNVFEQIMSWSPPFLQEPASANSAYHSQSMAQPYIADPSSISLGLLHRMLSIFALGGNFRAALRIFGRLQDTVDANRTISLDRFPAMVSASLGQDEEAVMHAADQPQAPGLNPQLPAIVIAPFLELITEVGDLELGRWLLYSNDVDGCIIPPSMYTDPTLQPALINFASVTGDERLLESVMQEVKIPLSESTLRALLHHQIRCGQWAAVHQVFELFRDVRGLAWAASDVLILAGAVLRHEKEAPDVSPSKTLAISPDTLLQRVMSGQFNKAQDPSKPRDLSQRRLLNQLARIIASVPSQLSRDLSRFCGIRYNQLSASQSISPRAFNHFLSVVTELFGLEEGKRLCEQWCSSPNVARSVQTPYVEHVVEPHAQTFYMFLRCIAHARITHDRIEEKTAEFYDTAERVRPHEQSIVDWAVARCLDLGLTLRGIKLDFPDIQRSCKDTRTARVDRTQWALG
ncbi:MAG: hypothetical protein Q9169_004940 [Polycauliona sp. 2 TL-2023]